MVCGSFMTFHIFLYTISGKGYDYHTYCIMIGLSNPYYISMGSGPRAPWAASFLRFCNNSVLNADGKCSWSLLVKFRFVFLLNRDHIWMETAL